MKKKFEELKRILNNNKKIVLTTHVTPDGDAIGSELAFFYYLKAIKKKVCIINHSATPEYLKFLDGKNIIKVFSENKEKNINIINDADLIILIDTNEYSRTRSMEDCTRLK